MRKKKTEKKEEVKTLSTGELVIQPVMEDESVKGTVGCELRLARESKHLDIEEIASSLRIKPCYIKALELSDYNDFPGQAYALGFLRTYSDFLELDTQALLARYREERSFIKPEKLDMPIHQKQHLFPYTKYFMWSVFIIAFVWTFWYFLTYSRVKESPLNEIKPALPAKQEEIVQKKEIIAETTAQTQNEKTIAAEEQTEQIKSRIKLVATQDVWMEISKEDSLIFSRTLKKGETYEVPPQSDDMFLKTGNAGGVEVYVDGQKVKPLGPFGAVRSGISLSADKLKNR